MRQFSIYAYTYAYTDTCTYTYACAYTYIYANSFVHTQAQHQCDSYSDWNRR